MQKSYFGFRVGADVVGRKVVGFRVVGLAVVGFTVGEAVKTSV